MIRLKLYPFMFLACAGCMFDGSLLGGGDKDGYDTESPSDSYLYEDCYDEEDNDDDGDVDCEDEDCAEECDDESTQ